MGIILDANCFGDFRNGSNKDMQLFAGGWLRETGRLHTRILRSFKE